ncbi:thiol-disulfide isomerase/thioredoxin [Kineococcus xinjiangensis]|uniref:Thiol-disulfide isomerase/thioredoxin n=1 Tax=Kineococcus xinjiangensis TaxID=512762 RepID=A0A2S6IK74_9ACTN|nr:redoxin domain-containing protein [Kineococcus xinjiangensis]PPK94634.1 thiol-disulfide isomerase/thioredoxin [Kineococcus xinjiangensis]
MRAAILPAAARPAAVLAVLLALSGCGGAEPAPAGAPEAPASAGAGTEAGTEVGTDVANPDAPELLRFTAATTAGERFDASELAGRDAVLWFWAPWCTQCQFEAEHFAAAQAAHADDVAFAGVAGLAPVADMEGFVEQGGVGAFPHLVDADGSLWQRFGVTAQPAHAFIDDSGEVEIVRGLLGAKQLEEKIAELVAK